MGNETRNWESWCRLCAKENGNEVNILTKSGNHESSLDLFQIIQRHFKIEISSYEDAPASICLECDKFVSDLCLFTERTKKVQAMYTELADLDNDSLNVDIPALRAKYGVSGEKGFLEKHIQASKRKGKKEIDDEEPVMEIDEIGIIGEDCLEVKIIEDERNIFVNINPPLTQELDNLKTEEGLLQDEEFDDYDDADDSDYVQEDGNYSENENNDEISADEDTQKPQKTTFKHICNVCEKSFRGEQQLNRHSKSCHDIPFHSKFMCSICDKEFIRNSHRRRHEKTVHKSANLLDPIYPCPFCDKKFQKAPNVKTHIKVVHSTQKPYICEECGKAFKTIGALKEHKYTHTEECPFQCSSCDKRFKNRARLKTHEDTHKDTTYVCTTCGLQLNTRRTLKMHMLVHSDQKKHKCNYCGNEFKRAKALKNHLILHTGLKPYTCNFCDKTFANGSNCRSHKKKSHPYELAALEATGTKSYCLNMPKLEHLKAAAQSQPNTTPQVMRKANKRPEPFPTTTTAMVPPKLEAIPTTISIDSSMTDPQSVIIDQQQTTPQRFHQAIQIENSNSNQSTPVPVAGQQIQLQQQNNYSVLASIYQPFQIGS